MKTIKKINKLYSYVERNIEYNKTDIWITIVIFFISMLALTIDCFALTDISIDEYFIVEYCLLGFTALTIFFNCFSPESKPQRFAGFISFYVSFLIGGVIYDFIKENQKNLFLYLSILAPIVWFFFDLFTPKQEVPNSNST